VTSEGYDPAPGAPPFTLDRWHRLEILVAENREVTLFLDGQLVASAHLADEAVVAAAGGHAGFYGGAGCGSHTAPFATGKRYNDNWSVAVWAP
jgi:hypothetical protein